MAELTLKVESPGQYAFKLEADRIGKYNLLGVLQIVQAQLTEEIRAGVEKKTTVPVPYGERRAQPAEGEVEMQKDQAIAEIFSTMEKLKQRVLAMKDAPADETFLVPVSLFSQI